MDDAEPEIVEIESEGLEDARLRLECFKSIVGMSDSELEVREAIRRAEFLHNWIRNYEQEEPEDPRSITPEAKCERRH